MQAGFEPGAGRGAEFDSCPWGGARAPVAPTRRVENLHGLARGARLGRGDRSGARRGDDGGHLGGMRRERVRAAEEGAGRERGGDRADEGEPGEAPDRAVRQPPRGGDGPGVEGLGQLRLEGPQERRVGARGRREAAGEAPGQRGERRSLVAERLAQRPGADAARGGSERFVDRFGGPDVGEVELGGLRISLHGPSPRRSARRAAARGAVGPSRCPASGRAPRPCRAPSGPA